MLAVVRHVRLSVGNSRIIKRLYTNYLKQTGKGRVRKLKTKFIAL